MPTYVYACEACGKQFEQFQSFKDDPLTVCRCGVEGKVRRVIQPAGVVFKGSGWYINDSRGASSSTVGADKAVASDTPAKADTSEKPAASDTAAKADTSEKSTKREPSSSSPEA